MNHVCEPLKKCGGLVIELMDDGYFHLVDDSNCANKIYFCPYCGKPLERIQPMKKYYLVRFVFQTPEANTIGEDNSAELALYANDPQHAVIIAIRLIHGASNFTVYEVREVDHV